MMMDVDQGGSDFDEQMSDPPPPPKAKGRAAPKKAAAPAKKAPARGKKAAAPPSEDEDDEDAGGSPSTLRLDALAVDCGVESGSASDEDDWGSVGEAIMRFWNSRCFASRRSRGAARRAMPRRYVSSASTRLYVS